MYQLGARSVLCTYLIRCAVLIFLPCACRAWLLIWAAIRDLLSFAVLSNVLLKVIPSIRMLGTKSTPRSFPVPIHPSIARALDFWMLSHAPEAFS